jgi:lysozyme family protein
MKEILIAFIKKWEGGFSNHPADKGGATNKGITIGTYTAYRKKHGLPTPTVTDLKNLTDKEWRAIFDEFYWQPCKADTISAVSAVNACVLVSWAWGSGVAGAAKLIQKNYGLKQDGVIGAATIAAVTAASFESLIAIRDKFFHNIVANDASQAVFLKGWLNRLAEFKTTFLPYVKKKR